MKKIKLNHHSLIGMGKHGHHSSASVLHTHAGKLQAEIFIKERLTRIKNEGGMLEIPLSQIAKTHSFKTALFCENSARYKPLYYETERNRNAFYFPILEKLGLTNSSSHFNPKVEFLTHHKCHGYSALFTSPFEKSLILVIDGVGSSAGTFDPGDPELKLGEPQGAEDTEWLTVYQQRGKTLTPVFKRWQNYTPQAFNQRTPGTTIGWGIAYAAVASHIFNSGRESGKVMGLAPFGRPRKITNATKFIFNLKEKNAFRSVGKDAWEASGRFKYYADLAASIQNFYEEELLKTLRILKRRYPKEENLIIVGGCALNCVANFKILKEGLFKKVYVSPFPSDEGVSLGAASYLYFSRQKRSWLPTAFHKQTGSFGPSTSIPPVNAAAIKRIFRGYKVERSRNISTLVANKLAEGQLIAWFQGRSESGPRALGHRSLLASPLVSGIRQHLNQNVKMRESFRPYAPSCLWEKSHEYFEVPRGFESPFMSFAVPIRKQYHKKLIEIGHVDNTARLQTVRKTQDPIFYELIKQFGKKTGFYCVLNTSLNVMGEPIVETPEDAKKFLDRTMVDGLAIGEFFISRPI